MARTTWDTDDKLPRSFQSAWNAQLAKLPLANFSMRLDLVRWEARQGHAAVLMLVEEEHRRGALVVRKVGRELHCGWPWRWQAALEPTDPGHAPGLSSMDAAWLFQQADWVARSRRLRCFLPAEPLAIVAAYPAGATICQAINHSDETLLSGMSANKRRLYRKASHFGYEIREAKSQDDFVAFRQLQIMAERLRGERDSVDEEVPTHGEGYREWELPWMKLLVAVKDNEVVAGVGDGIIPGGMVDGRAAAVSVDHRKHGVMALLCHHEARWLRDQGHRWLNHGGDTYFKREVAGKLGERIMVHCWLGGGTRWAGVNATEAWARRARPQVASWVRAVKGKRPKSS